MRRAAKKQMMQKRRHRRIRGKVSGTAERPRLVVTRSHKQIYAQVIDDVRGHTLCSASSLQLAKSGGLGDSNGGNLTGAVVVGAEIAKRALDAGVSTVSFDRAGYRYHGRVKALADAAREGGLKF